MKRKRPDITLWDACNVQEHGTMWRWWKSIRLREDKGGNGQTECIDEVDMIKTLSGFSSKLRRKEDSDTFLTTFSVGLKPTRFQKNVLNLMLKVTNYTYNWCFYLVNEMNVPAKQVILQKTVCRTNSKDVDPIYRLPGDEWFFDNKMSAIKKTACRNFCSSCNTAKKKGYKLKQKRDVSNCIREGSIGIQKGYIRSLTAKDKCRGPRSKHLVIMKNNFIEPVRINRSVDKIPPISHDFKIMKRANGRFVLQLPCDPHWTRRDTSNDNFEKSVCGIDPGGRTFATVYDPVKKTTYQVGIEEDKKFDLRPIHDKIDETHWHLTNAQKRDQAKAIEDRKTQLKKLHLRRKTFVKHIHTTLCSHLVKHYQLVSLGKLSVSRIVKKEVGKRGLPRRAKRDLLCWQHYQFRQRLQDRSIGTSCEVIIQNEAYTSKTCGVCGAINKTLGASETFTCNVCAYETNRDVNGARNILLKTLKMFPFANVA